MNQDREEAKRVLDLLFMCLLLIDVLARVVFVFVWCSSSVWREDGRSGIRHRMGNDRL